MLVRDEVSNYGVFVGCANWAFTLERFGVHFDVYAMGR